MTTVRLVDIRALQVLGRRGYCIPGAQAWFARHGLNWQLFVQHGIDAAIIEAIPDPMAQRVVAQARRREEQEQLAWAALNPP